VLLIRIPLFSRGKRASTGGRETKAKEPKKLLTNKEKGVEAAKR
jgi:hypothetical protein